MVPPPPPNLPTELAEPVPVPAAAPTALAAPEPEVLPPQDTEKAVAVVDVPFQVGETVEAQCVGWGPSWFPAVIRDILPSGDFQVLWAGDAPSISNVPSLYVRHKQGETPPPVAEPAVAATVPLPVVATVVPPPEIAEPRKQEEATPEPQREKAEINAGVQDAQRQVQEPPPTPATTVSPAQASAPAKKPPAAAPRTYRYDLGPGDDLAAPIANLRRRVEVEVRDGQTVSLILRIVRPEGRPDADAAEQALKEVEIDTAKPLAAPSADQSQSQSYSQGQGHGIHYEANGTSAVTRPQAGYETPPVTGNWHRPHMPMPMAAGFGGFPMPGLRPPLPVGMGCSGGCPQQGMGCAGGCQQQMFVPQNGMPYGMHGKL